MNNLSTRHARLKEMGVLQWYPRYGLNGVTMLPEEIVADLCSHSNIASSELNSEGEVLPFIKKVKPENQAELTELSAANLLQTKQGVPEENAKVLANAATSIDNQTTEPKIQENGLSLQDEGLKLSEDRLKESANFTLSTRAISLRCFRVRGCVVVTEVEQGISYELELDLLENILATCHFINDAAQNNAADHNNIAEGKNRAYHSFNWPVFSAKSMVELQNANHETIFKRWFDEQITPASNAFFYFGSGSTGHKTLCETIWSEKTLCENTLNQKPGALTSFYAFAHSLADLLALPAKKADVWSLISSQNALVDH